MAKNSEIKKKNYRILSVDVGFSSIKTTIRDNNGLLKFEKFYSSIAKLPERPLDYDDNQVFQFNGEYYIVGESSLKVQRSYLLKMETFEDLCLVESIWVSYLLKRYGGQDGSNGINNFDYVLLGLSIVWKDKGDEFIKYMKEALNIDRDDYFVLFVQAISCKAAYSEMGINLRERATRNNQKLRNALIIDGGMETLDCCSIINGTSSANTAIGADNSGTINIVYKIVDYVYKTYNISISTREGQLVLDTGILKRRGKTIDLQDKVDEFCKQYVVDVFTYLDSNFGEVLDSIDDGIIILGGFSYIYGKYIKDPEVAKKVDSIFSISDIVYPKEDGEYYNCLSYLRLAEKMLEEEDE